MPFGHMYYYATNSANPYYNYPPMGYSSFGFGSMMLLAWIVWILVVIALVLGIVWLWKQIVKK